jgi:hypothetical protein
MECEFCKCTFKSMSSLNNHKKTANYCLKIQGVESTKKFECESCCIKFTLKSTLDKHLLRCIYHTPAFKKIKDENSLLKNTIKELRIQLEIQTHNYTELSLTAVKRPVNNTKNIQINNFIQKMEPLRLEDIVESVPMLTLDHHVKGAEGYAEYALEFPFKDKIVCVDVNRNKIKYKDGEGNVIEDVGFQKMMIKLCESLKDRSFNLCQEHYEKLSDEFTEKELDEYNCMNTALAISRYANGRDNEFCNKMIKLISKGSTRSK